MDLRSWMRWPSWLLWHHEPWSGPHRSRIAVRILHLLWLAVTHNRRVGHGSRRRPHVQKPWIIVVVRSIIAVVRLWWRTRHRHASGAHWRLRRPLGVRVAQCRRWRAITGTLKASRVDVRWPVLRHRRRLVSRAMMAWMKRLMPLTLQARGRTMARQLLSRWSRCH